MITCALCPSALARASTGSHFGSNAQPVPGSSASPRSHAPTVRLSAEEVCTFEGAFKALARQGKAAFIAEGVPFSPRLEEKEYRRLIQSLYGPKLPSDPAALDIPLDKAILSVAEAFDYEVETPLEGNIYVLSKRYSQPADLPYVTLAEDTKSLVNIRRAIRVLIPQGIDLKSTSFPANQFVQTLDKSGLAALKEGIPVAELRPEQRQMIQQWGLYSYLAGFQETTERALFFFSATQKPDSVFRWMRSEETNTLLLECEGRFLPIPGPKNQFALSHGFYAQFLNGSSALPIPKGLFVTSQVTRTKPDEMTRQKYQKLISSLQINGQLPDPTAPTIDKTAFSTGSALPFVTTLDVFCTRLSLKKESGEAFHVTCDPALADKPVSVIGEEGAAPREILQKTASLYGLDILLQEDRSLLLTTRRPARIHQIENVKSEIEQQFPLPWRRLLTGNTHRVADKLMEQEKGKTNRGAALNQFRKAVLEQSEAPVHAQSAIYNAAMHRLRTLIEPEIAASSDRQLSLSKAGDEEHRLLALLCMVDALNHFEQGIRQPLPHYLTEPGNAYVRGYFGPDGDLGVVAICYRQKSGAILPEQTFDLRYMTH